MRWGGGSRRGACRDAHEGLHAPAIRRWSPSLILPPPCVLGLPPSHLFAMTTREALKVALMATMMAPTALAADCYVQHGACGRK